MGMLAQLDQISTDKLATLINDPGSAYEWFLPYSVGARQKEIINVLERLGKSRKEAITEMIKGMQEAAESQNLPAEVKRQVALRVEQFQALMNSNLGPSPATPSADEPKRFSLEKDWHMLHYGLSGTAEPGDTWISKSILGGREIPDLDQTKDYGPLRYFDSKEVKAISSELATVDPQSLIFNLNKDDAARKSIYLADTLDDLREWDHLPQLFTQFRDFYADAARHGNAMLLSIT